MALAWLHLAENTMYTARVNMFASTMLHIALDDEVSDTTGDAMKIKSREHQLCPAFENNYSSVLHVFYDACDTLATAYTGGNHAIFFIEAFHVLQDLNSEFTSGASKGVP